MEQFPEKMVIIGTDSHVGKTFVSAVLTLGLKGKYWKPIQCGVSPCTDTEWVHETTGLPSHHFLRESYLFGETIPPFLQHSDVKIDPLVIQSQREKGAHLIIEGARGVMEPLNDREFFLDFLKKISIPALLVVKNDEGAVNQTMLTLEKLKAEGIPVFGLVLNGPKNELNRRAIEEFCKLPRIFEMDFISHITENTLKRCFEETFQACVGCGPFM